MYNIPIMITFFIRPHSLLNLLNIVYSLNPKKIYFVCDGPRDSVLSDSLLIEECKLIVDQFDWPGEVSKIYSPYNKGILKNGYDAMKEIFRSEEKLIVIEDDYIPNSSFFLFMKECLDKYQYDSRISLVNGTNTFPLKNNTSDDYFFSKLYFPGASGYWRRTFEKIEYIYNNDYSNYKYSLLNSVPKFWKKKVLRAIKKLETTFDVSKVSHEAVFGLDFYLNNTLAIIPNKNLATTADLKGNSAHAPNSINKLPRRLQKIQDFPTFQIDSAIKHPRFINESIPYQKYVSRSLAGPGYPYINLLRNTERFFRYWYFGSFSEAIKETMNWLNNRNNFNDKNG